MKIKYIVIFLTILMTYSCGSKKRVVSSKKPSTSENSKAENSIIYSNTGNVKTPPKTLNLTESYIYQYADIAQQEMRLFGIPASITLAQGILESGNGQGNLTKRSNNHFGIKCNGWEGAKVYHDDDASQECFRKYSRAEYSYRDHSLFLFNRSRYAFLFDYEIDDYKSWAKGLKKAGYATDPKYPKKLTDLIERYKLYQYDKGISIEKKSKIVKPLSKSTNIHIVKKGETLYSISNKYGIEIKELIRLNKVKDNVIKVGQKLNLQ